MKFINAISISNKSKAKSMTIIGDVAKGILIFYYGYYLFLTITQAITGQTALAVLLLIGFIFPLSILVYGYIKTKEIKRIYRTIVYNKKPHLST